jgi:hypothetical protein
MFNVGPSWTFVPFVVSDSRISRLARSAFVV